MEREPELSVYVALKVRRQVGKTGAELPEPHGQEESAPLGSELAVYLPFLRPAKYRKERKVISDLILFIFSLSSSPSTFVSVCVEEGDHSKALRAFSEQPEQLQR